MTRFGKRVVLTVGLLERRQLLATITVNSVGDADGADGSASLSLRQAIEISDGTLAIGLLSGAQAALVSGPLASPNILDFAIPGTGPFTIRPASALPAITSPAVIDGYSQPGSHPNTNGPGQGRNTVIQIALDGTQAGTDSSGLDLEAGGSTVRGLAIGGFNVGLTTGSSMTVSGSNRVEGNFIGTDVTGTKPLPNRLDGLDLSGSSDSIGGTAAGAGNVISGNNGVGLNIEQLVVFHVNIPVPANDVVQGNLIGTDVTGLKPLPNGQGIELTGQSMTIGGTVAGAGNVISGNRKAGLAIRPGVVFDSLFPSSALVEGNRVGTDVSGTGSLPNGGDGIDVSSSFATIGGTSAGARNVISGNVGDGLSTSFDNLVEGNFIGTDGSGLKPLPNGGNGITGSEDVNTTIGGTTRGAGNVISGNAGDGLSLNSGFGSSANRVEGNFIGTDSTGTRVLPNGGDGVSVVGFSNTIGGTTPGASNVIANNLAAGVSIGVGFRLVSTTPIPPNGSNPTSLSTYRIISASGQANTISGNSIFANQGLGIELLSDSDSFAKAHLTSPMSAAEFQVAPGDPTGGNALLAAPIIQSVRPAGGSTLISGTISGLASTGFTVELFANPDGSGQGRTFLGSTTATTNASGVASFNFETSANLIGSSVTATATDSLGDTSEFARAAHLDQATSTTLSGPSGLSVLGAPVVFTAIVGSGQGVVPTGSVLFAEGGVVLASVPVDASGQARFVTSQLGIGSHVIEAAYLGDPSHLTSLSNFLAEGVLPSFAFGGPTVTSTLVSTANSVTIGFSRPLSIGTAQDIRNYAIIGPDGRALTIESAVYDPVNRSVMLTTGSPLKPHKRNRITVNGRRIGGVTDVDRIPLDGQHDGRPGTNYSGSVINPGFVPARPHPKTR